MSNSSRLLADRRARKALKKLERISGGLLSGLPDFSGDELPPSISAALFAEIVESMAEASLGAAHTSCAGEASVIVKGSASLWGNGEPPGD